MIQGNSDKPKIIMICGPTAIGKTSVAIETAEAVGGEIVGADSVQIYRHMDIGTAKPTPEEKRRVAHHMIDIVNPDESYDAARFSLEARASVNQLLAWGHVPLVAGGTGFYVKALLYGLCEAAPENGAIRTRLREEADRGGGQYLHQRLKACDPEAAAIIHPNDVYRIIRALEVYEASGMSMTEFRRRHGFSDAPYNVLKIGLFMDRQALYARIEQRVDRMIAQGLHDEVRQLLAAGYHENLRSMQSLGYRHMTAYIQGKTDHASAVAGLKKDTRNYAKRQLTWFRKDSQTTWFEPDQINRIIACARAFLDQ